MIQRQFKPLAQSRPVTSEERAHYAALLEQLREARRKSGMSQAALDDEIGVSEGLVAKWEIGDRLPGAFFLMCWCKALGVRLKIEKDCS